MGCLYTGRRREKKVDKKDQKGTKERVLSMDRRTEAASDVRTYVLVSYKTQTQPSLTKGTALGKVNLSIRHHEKPT